MTRLVLVSSKKTDHFIVSGGGKAEIPGVGGTAIAAISIPRAGFHHFADVGACTGNGQFQAVNPVAFSNHQGSGIAVVPNVEITSGGERNGHIVAQA